MRALTIIPARAGSQRLPKKNIKLLGDIPLVQHSINYALNNKNLTGDIYVSTDDESVKEIAIKCGVDIIDRPASLTSSTATTASVLAHALASTNKDYDYIILLQPTNPLRPKNLLQTAMSTFHELTPDSLMTVSRHHHKLGKIKDNRFIPFNYEMGQRSQDLEPLYYENGLLYISKPELIKKEIILGERNAPYIVDHPYATVDIDELLDFEYAQFIMNTYINE